MKKFLLAAGALPLIFGVQPARAGGFYGLHWDGSAEHFVSLDPYTSTMTNIATIPDVKYISVSSQVVDPDSGLYAFSGMEAGSARYYYVIDIRTGAVVAKPSQTINVNGMIFSPGDQKVFGVTWNVADSTEYFVAVNPYTGVTTSTAVPGVKATQLNSYVFDSDSGRYAFSAITTTGARKYYVLDAATGALIAQVPQFKNINNMVYNPLNGKVHGLWWSDSSAPAYTDSLGRHHPSILEGTEYFVTLTPFDSSTTLTEIPGVKYISTAYAFDSDSNRYVFVGMGSSTSSSSYYVIDATTGAVISQSPVAEKVDNIAYFRSAPSGGGTVHVASPLANGRAVRVESSGDFVVLDMAHNAGTPDEMISFSIRDISGKILLRKTEIQSGRTRIDTHGLKSGIHLYQIRNGRSVLGAGKILIR